MVKLCVQCHHMLEDQEELLEQWFFKHYANGLDLDLEVFFCIDKLRSMLFFSSFFLYLFEIKQRK